MMDQYGLFLLVAVQRLLLKWSLWASWLKPFRAVATFQYLPRHMYAHNHMDWSACRSGLGIPSPHKLQDSQRLLPWLAIPWCVSDREANGTVDGTGLGNRA
ncbi:hypothetical protein BD289DRAFT_159850 [Coniella lustricola]|uniref:Uncharacterized protein n=1 Tax=Coniella lustricola TaxID=2025994 RepID=A0A2T3AEN1_9PEZI|nr:hypothetical protein BD289DRAFT_159850 [Coniella lustricola]